MVGAWQILKNQSPTILLTHSPTSSRRSFIERILKEMYGFWKLRSGGGISHLEAE